MNPYSIMKFLHIAGVLLLFAATTLELAGLWGLHGARTVGSVREVLRLLAPLKRMFATASLLILISGLFMVITVWGWTTAWIDIGLLALVTTSAVAPRINGPRFAAIARAAAGAPADAIVPGDLRAAIGDPVLRTAILTLAFSDLGIVYLMTAKPVLVEAVVAMGIAIGLGLVAGQPWRGVGVQPAARSAPPGLADWPLAALALHRAYIVTIVSRFVPCQGTHQIRQRCDD